VIRAPIDVYCDHDGCDRMTKATAIPEETGFPSCGAGLRYDDVRFPDDALGLPSAWTYSYRVALCPDHQPKKSP